jgi:hypothetical protein
VKRLIGAAVSLFSVLSLVGLGLPGSTAASEAEITWNKVALGAPVSTLRPLAGDPLRVLTSNDGSTHIGRYWVAGSDSTFFLVLEKRGYVEGFDVFTTETAAKGFENVPPDPSGAHLGDTFESVKALHPDFHLETADDGAQQLVGRVANPVAGVVYEFQDGHLRSFQWGVHIDDALLAVPVLGSPAGDAPASAILDVQKSEAEGVRWEYLYLSFHPCDGDTRWRLQQQVLSRENGHVYDRLHVICPSTKTERNFYFDIGSYFGKI